MDMRPASALVMAGFVVLGGCSGSRSPCDSLVYTADGVAKQEYLPCALQILDTMKVLDRRLESYGGGNESARAEALQAMYDLRRLIGRAGGREKLRSRWRDPQLTAMNDAIYLAYEVYSLEVVAVANPDKRLREYSAHNHSLAKSAASRARLHYESAAR